MGQKLKIAGWVSLGVMAGALTTVSLQTVARGTLAPLPLEELQQLAAVFGMVKSNYVEPVDDKKLITDAIVGMVSSLDPHSQYLDKKSLKEFNEGTTGKFVGVGIEISQEEGLIKVVSPIEGSPAFRAGLKPNEKHAQTAFLFSLLQLSIVGNLLATTKTNISEEVSNTVLLTSEKF